LVSAGRNIHLAPNRDKRVAFSANNARPGHRCEIIREWRQQSTYLADPQQLIVYCFKLLWGHLANNERGWQAATPGFLENRRVETQAQITDSAVQCE
jgi:hypothetical protein